MKLILTYDEAVKAIRSYYKFGPEFSVEIQSKNPLVNPPETKSTEEIEMNTFIRRIQSFRYSSDEKLAAIKEVRWLGGYGLVDARFIVEHWGEFIFNANLLKRLPKVQRSKEKGIDHAYFV